jgi:hypothetical protein
LKKHTVSEGPKETEAATAASKGAASDLKSRNWGKWVAEMRWPGEKRESAAKANLLKRYQELCKKHITTNTLTVSIRQLTKAGTHQPITAQGRKVMVKSMKELGIIVMERILVQQLLQSACILNDDQLEYLIIDGNHCIETARSLFPEENFTWLCDLIDICLSH